jgi:uncharacterized protein YlxW (UPF0749 family)
MKDAKSKIALALVCILLGFLLTNKFRALSARSNNIPESTTEKTRIANQIESINQENQKLEKENNDLIANIKNYEERATKEGSINQSTKTQLDSYRMILGTSDDAKGQGIILSITPMSTIFSNNTDNSIENTELVYLVNQLIVAGAEAISLNDKRITSQTGIRSSGGNNSYILVNDEKVSPSRKITIKAIGDKKKLQDSVSKVDKKTYPRLAYYDLKVEASNSVTVSKYNKKYQMNYIKPASTTK